MSFHSFRSVAFVSSLAVLGGVLHCGSSSPSGTGDGSGTGSGSGTGKGSGTGTGGGTGSGSGTSPYTDTTTCNPVIDLSTATTLSPPTTTVAPSCLAPSAVAQNMMAVVTSQAALTALFAPDAGSSCTVPSGVDFTASQVVVVNAEGSVSVHQKGTTAVITEGYGGGGFPAREVYILVLPATLTPELQVCVTTCTGECPG